MTNPSPELKLEVKKLILNTLSLNDINPEDIDDDKPIFGGGNALTLDSVDAIEIIMAIQREYGYRIADQQIAREVIRSVSSIAKFISDQRNQSAG